jgi:3-hydroxyacyl-CoA dehydrogenase
MSRLHHEAQAGFALAAVNRPATNALPLMPHGVRRVGIVGANATGIGIAMSLLDADIPVTVFELERASLDKGIATARSAYGAAVAQGRLAAASRERRMGLLAGTINFHHLKDCDLVIEAVSTELGIKAELFRRLDDTVKPGAILVTCSSPASVDHLAACTRRAGEVIGLQLSSPAHVGETWTLNPGKASAGQSLATVLALVQHLGKACAVSGNLGSDAGHAGAMPRIEHGGLAWQVSRIVE